jgi:hypothetical protein
MMVALKTGVGEVTYCPYASMLPRDDMIDFMRRPGGFGW